MAEHVVGQANDFLKNGEMTRLELEGKPVVVVRVEDEYHAFGGNCPHYGAPLDKGLLKGQQLTCPWHHACFDVRSGARIEPPTLNDLAHFPVNIDDNQIKVTLPHDNIREPQGKATTAETYIIIGGGAAGNAASEELRRAGFAGKIIILSAASTVPIDRPNLSKDYLSGKAQPDWIPLRGASWYAERDIDLRLNTTVKKLDPKAKTVQLESGETLKFDKLLLAMGAVPRQLDVPGKGFGNVFTLRELPDATQILETAKVHKRAVVVGASFIGMEVAASLADGHQVDVTVVGIEALPFDRILGDDLGRMFKQLHEENGIQFRLNSGVEQFKGENGRVTGIELKGGEILPADFVVVGVGVKPNTDFLKDSGLTLDPKDQSVHVNAQLQTNFPDIFAAGDIARWHDGDNHQRIEHWRVAQQQGIVAGWNMVGHSENYNERVPFFWTNQWKVGLRYVGHATKWDEIVYRYGTPEQRDFVAFYVEGGQVKAAAGFKHDLDMDAIEVILQDRKPLTPAQMRDTSFDLVAYAKKE